MGLSGQAWLLGYFPRLEWLVPCRKPGFRLSMRFCDAPLQLTGATQTPRLDLEGAQGRMADEGQRQVLRGSAGCVRQKSPVRDTNPNMEGAI